jgi:hypothetical protein
MSPRVRSQKTNRTPIELIFEKVMRRKMTQQEKVYLHVARKIRPPTSAKINRSVRAAVAAQN